MTAARNYSPWHQWMVRLAATRLEDPLPEDDPSAIPAWVERRRVRLHELLGREPEPVPLDVETLELLESLLVEYQGTVLLVSHDRAFLNEVVTSTLAIEPDGKVREYDGGYDDYLRQRSTEIAPEPKSTTTITKTPSSWEKPRRLSLKERKELEKKAEK